MRHYLVIAPRELENKLLSECKRLLKKVYKIEHNGLFYRVKTKNKLDNPRRLFIKGDGRVITASVKPHISLIHNIELSDTSNFIEKVKGICEKYSALNLEFDGYGNYDMNFTFFVRFKDNRKLKELRKELLEASVSFMSKEEFNQHTEKKFVPHATVLYDDIEPDIVIKAYNELNPNLFPKNITVQKIILWEVTPTEQKVISEFPLSG